MYYFRQIARESMGTSVIEIVLPDKIFQEMMSAIMNEGLIPDDLFYISRIPRWEVYPIYDFNIDDGRMVATTEDPVDWYSFKVGLPQEIGPLLDHSYYLPTFFQQQKEMEEKSQKSQNSLAVWMHSMAHPWRHLYQ